MIEMHATNEMFSIRDGEISELYNVPPKGRFIGVMLSETPGFPPGPVETLTHDGKKITTFAIIACQRNKDGRWQHVQLTPATKGTVGDILMACMEKGTVEANEWYFLKLTNKED